MAYSEIIHPAFPNIPHDRTLVVGDTEFDVEFAHNINADSCWAAYGYGNRERCIALKPTYIIESFAELLSIHSLST